MKQPIGEFLAVLRKSHGLTQQEVADRLGVSNRTVSAWERGTVMPDILLLPELAELYEVTVDEILAGERTAGALPLPEQTGPAPFENKLAQFTMWLIILAALFAVSYAIFFAGWYLHAEAYRLYGSHLFEWWWQILLYGGLILTLLTLTVLFALWRRWESLGGTDRPQAYLRALRKRVAYFCFAAGGVSLLFLIVTAFPLGNLLSGMAQFYASQNGEGPLVSWIWAVSNNAVERLHIYIAMAAVFFVASAAFFVCGLLLVKLAPKESARCHSVRM